MALPRAVRALSIPVVLALLVACGPAATPTPPPKPTTAPAAQPAAASTSAPTAAPAPTTAAAPTTAPAAASAAAGAATAAAKPAPTTTYKVTLVLDWFPNTNHSGIYLAKAKGWYAAQGIDLDVQVPSDPSASMKLVGSGNAEIGISYQPAVEIARAQEVPVVSVAALLQHNTAAYASKNGKNIARPKDWEGKKFGTSGLAQIEPTVRTVMKCDNADFSKVEMVNIGQKLSPALLADQVDVVPMLPAWEGIELEMKGNQLKYVQQRDFCVPDLYTIVFIAGEKTLAEKPEAVKRFLAATAQGYEYAARNPAEAADALLKASPELDANLVKKSQEILSTQYIADANRWGVQRADQWKKHADWMAENKLIAKAIDSSKAFTNDFLPTPVGGA
jgi:ABC-type nitrate/sulfonate/bicarbonate transport system substrate-binding protein